MTGFLQRVCAEAKDRVAQDRRHRPDAAVMAAARARPPASDLAAALAGDGVAVITEIKRASPSRGHMAAIPDPASLGRDYAAGGAAAISVLTEPTHFEGSLDDLAAVAAATDLPVLRKDFTVDAYQIWQARAAGAAAVLLILAALDDRQLASLMTAADDAGLDSVVETHTAAEAARAVRAHERVATGRRLILGVNTRNLASLQVDPSHFARIRSQADVPSDALLVAESGVRGPADVTAYAAAGADAVLVGEHVSTAADPRATVAALATAT